jgi:hypothetical protein
MHIEALLEKVDKHQPWDDEPFFCFTSDIDWASEAVLDIFFSEMLKYNLELTTFVTHESPIIEDLYQQSQIQRGIHPNFLPSSSHGNGFREVIDNCLMFAPEAKGFRSHRAFDVTDTSHLFNDQFGLRYASNLVTVMQPFIKPIIHESGLVRFPVFFEDGTHLYNKLGFDFSEHKSRFLTPGIKIISIHPMNYVINPPDLGYMRNIKDTLSREAYSHTSYDAVNQYKYSGLGIKNLVDDIIDFVGNHRIFSIWELYQQFMS